MMRFKTLFLVAAALLAGACHPNAILKTDIPTRPAGQENVIGLTAEPLETVRIGIVGLGMRGEDAVVRLSYVPGAVVTALCDILPERVTASRLSLASLGKPAAKEFSGAEDAWNQLKGFSYAFAE